MGAGVMKKELVVKLSQMADFEVRLLKIFQAVVESGGFTAAETELNISRSTISTHIAKLEDRLKLKLCRRGRAGFSLTEEGEVVYNLMTELFSALETFRAGVNNLHVALTGELKIIASDTVCLDSRSAIPEAIAEFSRQAPDVKVLLDVKAMTDIERMIINDEADVGYIPFHRQVDGLEYSPLYADECHLYCSHNHPLFKVDNVTDIVRQLPESKVVHAGVQTSAEVAEQLAGMNKAAISYFYEARLAMILSGAYIGFMPDSYVQEYVASGKFKTIIAETKNYSLGVAAITRSHGKINRARQLYVDIAKELR